MITSTHIHIFPPLVFRSLAVSPLVVSKPRAADYATLDEALTTGRVRITEVGEAGSVPELKLLNDTDQPILLLDGEELTGAKQNRICNLTILAPPRAETVIPVSCVEAGRWYLRSQTFATSDNIYFAEGRARKSRDVSDSLERYSAPHARQGQVWSDISEKLGRLSAQSGTTAMFDAFVQRSDELDGFVEALRLPPQAVGAVFSLNGRPLGLEFFENPALCAKLGRKLIRSWALDAIDHGADPGPPAEPTRSQVADFLAAVSAAPSKRFKVVGLGETVRFIDGQITGGALVFDGRLIHVMAFSVECHGAEHRH
ncbi:ARPP-1 family domain-containing protein [Methyloceanibacter sp.]|uniref:ARPP-1 family domain-containing protein n=1 Tax=Methyloceanibacter sp. TaxID=1965321 RepID=UPI003D6CF21C